MKLYRPTRIDPRAWQGVRLAGITVVLTGLAAWMARQLYPAAVSATTCTYLLLAGIACYAFGRAGAWWCNR